MNLASRSKILHALRRQPLTRRECARITGLTYGAVASHFLQLVELGLIEPAGKVAHEGMGAPYRRYRLVPIVTEKAS